MVNASTEIMSSVDTLLAQSLREGYLLFDQNNVVTAADTAVCVMLGYELDRLVGKSAAALWADDFSVSVVGNIKEPRMVETAVRQADGRLLPVALTIAPLSGELDHTMVTISPLNKNWPLDESLSHVQRLAGIGTMTASVAHELNTPISVIISTCSNMKYEIEDNNLSVKQLLHYIGMIEKNAWRSARIMETLRDYSMDHTLEREVADLNMILKNGLTLIEQQFRDEFNVKIETDFAPSLKTIICDPNRITQALLNLLTNARDAMPDGGVIKLKSWALPLPENGEGTENKRPFRFAFSVRDHGSGIQPALMEQIFDPFFTTKQAGKGSGLGLYIARRIVKQHNGRLIPHNNPDGGATFVVNLP